MACPFGREFASNFVQDSALVNLNQGATGTACVDAFEAQMTALRTRAAFPDKYYLNLRNGTELRVKERSVLGELLDSDPTNVVFVQNATHAVNAVLRSFPFQRGDKILLMNTTFHNCVNTLQFLSDQQQLRLVKFAVQYPLTNEQLLAQFRKILMLEKPRMAFFDTVVSYPSVLLPWEEMCEICNELGVLSLVDGAHGIGILDISLRQAEPTFFISNVHKWFWVAPGCAVLYVDPNYHNSIQGFPISITEPDYRGEDRLARLFAYCSSIDYSVVDSFMAAANFRRSVGESRIKDYQNKLAMDACKLVCDSWKVREFNSFKNYDGFSGRLALFTVKCPVQPELSKQKRFCKYCTDRLVEKYNSNVTMISYEGEVWVRFSSAPFLELKDFEYGMEALNECFESYKASSIA